MRTAWSFLNREPEIEAAARVLTNDTPPGGGAILIGPRGVGRSALFRAVLDRVADRYTPVITVRLTGTVCSARVDGARHLFTTDRLAAGDLSGLIENALRRPGEVADRALLAVDDLHLIDATTATLVYFLVSGGTVRLLGTGRSEAPMPRPIAALWREDHVRTLIVGPLPESTTRALLDRAAGQPLDPATATTLLGLADGDLVALRENIEALTHSGALTDSPTGLRWSGDPRDLITNTTQAYAHRFRALRPGPRAVVALTALADPLGVVPATTLTSARAVSDALAEGLIMSRRQGRRLCLRVSTPLAGIGIRQCVGAHECHTLLTGLAGLITDYGATRREDPPALGRWHLDHGVRLDHRVLTRAAAAAFTGPDPRTAARLADAARDWGAGFEAVDLRAQATAWLGDHRGALALLDRHAGLPATDRERLRWHVTRAVIGFVLLGDRSVVDRAHRARAVLPAADGQVLTALAAVIRIATGETSAVPTLRGLAADAAPPAAVHARAGLVAVDVLRGVPDQGRALARLSRTVGPEHRRSSPLCGLLELARWTVVLITGRSPGPRPTIGMSPLVTTQSALTRAITHRLRGEPRAALASAREAARFPGGGPLRWAAAAETAHAAALLGDVETATAALAGCEHRHTRLVGHLVEPARIQVTALTDPDHARHLTDRLARAARIRGVVGVEILALHAAVRLDHVPATLVDRLRVLAALTREPVHEAVATHAVAVHERDPDGLCAAAKGFTALDLRLAALEATAQRFGLLWGSRAVGVGSVAAELASALADCPALGVPALRLPVPRLTSRRWQVAELAADGVTTAGIAEALHIEEKSVESHLYRIYPALSVPNRTELAGVISLARSLGWTP